MTFGCKCTNGQGLFDVLQEELKNLGLDIDSVRGQSYDNGANMKGKNNGVQRKLLDKILKLFIPHVVVIVLS